MRSLALGIRTLSLALLVACGQSEAVDSPAPEVPALDVWTVEVRQETVVEPVVGTGSIGPHKMSNIGPRVDGIIEEILVRVGDRVEGGAPLFRTRDIHYRIRVNEAEHARIRLTLEARARASLPK